MRDIVIKESASSKGLKIKFARFRAGLKQYELAAKVGITPTQLCEIEGGRREPSDDLLQRILEVIEVNHDGKSKQQT